MTTTNDEPDLSGLVLDDRYELVRRLGMGGMGSVYEARHVRIAKSVAIKVLHREYAYKESFRRRFLREAQAASLIRHKNVVAIHDFGYHEDVAYIVMDLLEGRDLHVLIHERAPLPWAGARRRSSTKTPSSRMCSPVSEREAILEEATQVATDFRRDIDSIRAIDLDPQANATAAPDTIRFAIGALASGRLDDLWLGSVRVWMLICFGFLSLGLILGGRWAYEELGWGGYWAWDPVENAGLMPWFTATAFLHSAIIQEQRGKMKRWNMVLVIVTFFLTIFGTFMTRSGIVQSVHAFGEDNVLALQFVAFLAFIMVVSVGLLVYRSNQLSSTMELESWVSREFAFLANNWILLACAGVVLFLTMLPTMSEAFADARMSVGIEYFNRTMTPLGETLLLLAGGAPLLAWRKTTRERLWSQFLFPTALAAVTVLVLAVAFPQTRHLSTLFTDGLEISLGGDKYNLLHLPVTLLNFGLVAFVFGSIVQEFWRGVAVRRRQTGSDPVTSLLGLVLTKRRKYGGYIVHLGVAVMFFGFAGKAYESMKDATIEKPAAMGDRAKATVHFEGYDLVYERLFQRSDDHMVETGAEVSIWRDGKKIGMAYPAKRDYAKGEGQATTEVSIETRVGEDVYLVLNGYNLESGLGNLRVYLNPLILWVWVGFLILALGTLICLIPQGVVDQLSRPRTSRLGRAADAAVLALLVGGAITGVATQAHAAPPAEHIEAGMGMGADSVGYASMNRPKNATEERAMKELLCVCGCKRESFFDCKCATAAQLRQQVIELVEQVDASGKPIYDLASEHGRDVAYQAVLDFFVQQYKGEQVLATPRTQFSWLFPSVAVIGGLGLLVVAGRRFVGRGAAAAQGASTTAVAPAATTEDAAYADKLDDELAETE